MEFYIKSLEDPGFDPSSLQVDDELGILLTQIEMCLFTKRGDVLGNTGFGANLEDYVYALQYNDTMISSAISQQFKTYIPLAQKYNTQVSVEFLPYVEKNVAFIDITIDNKYRIEVYI